LLQQRFLHSPIIPSPCSISLTPGMKVKASSICCLVLTMPYAPANAASTKNEARTAACLLVRLASAFLFQFTISVATASAQSPASTIEKFGLFGIWADDCRSGPSPSNQYASFSVTSRGIIHLHNDFGPDYGDMLYRIVDAKRVGQLRISLRQLLTTDDQVALDIIMLKSNDRIRVWSSRGADGSEYVQDGLIPAANNRETRWMERCDTRSASNLILADNKGAEDAQRWTADRSASSEEIRVRPPHVLDLERSSEKLTFPRERTRRPTPP
jgi:hypothetical protein